MTKSQTAWKSRIVGHGTEKPDALLANPRNWRIHPKAQQDAMAGALDQVGWVQNVIVNNRTGHIVDGHLRAELAISRGEASIPVVYVDLSDEEEAIVLASYDPLAGMAVTDQAQLDALLEEVSFDSKALEDAIRALAPSLKDGLTDPDDVPEPPDEPYVKPGDLWLLGDHRLMCGDSTKAEDVDRLMGGDRAACMWTDPPYGVSYVGGTKDALRIQNDEAAGIPDLLAAAFARATDALAPGAPVYVARPAVAVGADFLLAFMAAGWKLHEELQWVKDTMVLGHSDYHLKHETIVYGWTAGPGRSGRGRHEGSRWYGPQNATSVFEVARPKASPDHPTGKPVELVAAMLTNSTQAGDAVFEPFSGSGTTIIASETLGRRCYAMELEPRYVQVAIERWQAFTGKEAVRDGQTRTAADPH
jgi:hypothetical protein